MVSVGVKSKLTIHPLFLVVGLVCALTGAGGFLLFLSATFAALEHEFAHALAARRYGYALDRIVLMPYGAVIKGDISDMGRAQKLWVLAAGPLCNAATALLFVAVWWLYPEAYPYTESAFHVSLSLFLVNLLPAYPLDGGRALRLLIERRSKKAARIVGITGNLLSVAGLIVYFVFSCIGGAPNFSCAVFAALLAAGVFGQGGSYAGVRIARKNSFTRGLEERRVVLSCDCSLNTALKFLSEERYLVIILYDDDAFFGEMTEGEYLAALSEGDYLRTFRSVLPQSF